MNGFKTFNDVKITDDKESKTYTGVRIRPAADASGYYAESIQDPLKRAYITEKTYQAIIADEEVNIHI